MTEQQAMTMAKDPVRGMDVDPTTTKHRDDFQGQDDSCRRLMSRRALADDRIAARQARRLRETAVPRLKTSRSVLALGALLTASLLGTAVAQDATPGVQHDQATGHASGSPTADSPYADGYDPAAPIRALTPEEISQIEHGEGAGFALPAELNGVPGPSHVLTLADELGLSSAQHTQVQAIFDEMRAAVIPAGARYLAAQQALEADFRAGTLTETDLPGRIADVFGLEGELVAAHLLAHLQTAQVLTPAQITAYNRLRGYE